MNHLLVTSGVSRIFVVLSIYIVDDGSSPAASKKRVAAATSEEGKLDCTVVTFSGKIGSVFAWVEPEEARFNPGLSGNVKLLGNILATALEELTRHCAAAR